MEEVKISLEISDIKVNIQCDPAWLASQITVLAEKYPEMFNIKTAKKEEPLPDEPFAEKTVEEKKPETLKAFLIRNKATAARNKLYLGTAVWLTFNGKEKILPMDIRKAFENNGIPLMKNPGNCLYQLKKQGLCRSEGKSFAVNKKGLEGFSRK